MNLQNYFRNMELLGFKIYGKGHLFIYQNYKKEVIPTIYEKTIQDCIINDIIEACKEDLESKQNNKNIEKIIKEIIRGGLLNEKL